MIIGTLKCHYHGNIKQHTVYVQNFELCKFQGFRGQLFICEIFILEILLANLLLASIGKQDTLEQQWNGDI